MTLPSVIKIQTMTLLSYWTIPYVCLEDARLVWLYNLAFLTVISSLLANIFCHMTYLQSDNLSGIAQVIITFQIFLVQLKYFSGTIKNPCQLVL